MASKPWVDGLTIGEVLSHTAERFPEKEAIVFCQPNVRMNWREVEREVDRIALGLIELGYRHGDHFGVWASNWPEWVLLQFATARIGVVLVTINPSYRPAELAYALAQSDVRGLALIEQFRSSNYDAILEEVWPGLASAQCGNLRSEQFPKLRHLIRMRGSDHQAMLSWDAFVRPEFSSKNRDTLRAAAAAAQPNDPINLQYTSGTTGNPKGALLTHRNLLLNAYHAGQGQRLDETDRIGIPVPLYHCFGCVLGTLCATVWGSTMVFPHECFLAVPTLDAIESEKCTAVYGVPTMFIAMLEQPDFATRDTSSLRTGIMAGSPCPIELMKRVTTEMGAREITIAYGQTEASPLITMTRTDDPLEKRVGTVGQVLPGVEAKVVDPATGELTADGVSGELCTRGHNVMLEYYHQPEQTAAAIDDDGWLHTGDLAVRQPDGYFRITGRMKDTIIRGGENISPREIEELLYQHPAVEEVQVLGVPDLRFGEEVLACIRKRSEPAVTEDEIREFCRSRLAHFKTPRHVWFMEAFPTTVTGKVQKFRLRDLAIEQFQLQDAAAVQTA
ncbi:MAG: AMP-binding protein [Pirellulales bacterium]